VRVVQRAEPEPAAWSKHYLDVLCTSIFLEGLSFVVDADLKASLIHEKQS